MPDHIQRYRSSNAKRTASQLRHGGGDVVAHVGGLDCDVMRSRAREIQFGAVQDLRVVLAATGRHQQVQQVVFIQGIFGVQHTERISRKVDCERSSHLEFAATGTRDSRRGKRIDAARVGCRLHQDGWRGNVAADRALHDLAVDVKRHRGADTHASEGTARVRQRVHRHAGGCFNVDPAQAGGHRTFIGEYRA